jgi:hypothetical protein
MAPGRRLSRINTASDRIASTTGGEAKSTKSAAGGAPDSGTAQLGRTCGRYCIADIGMKPSRPLFILIFT